MERLVLGYDGSAAAESALDWVSDRALQRDTLVEVVTVASMLHSGSAHTDRLLEQAEQRLRTRVPGLPVETSRADGMAARALTAVAADADLLVIGVDGARPLRTAAHGWIPQRVATAPTGPVCVVPAGWSPVVGPVTVGLDDDGSSEQALDFAAAEAEATGNSLKVVHAWSLPAGEDDPAPALSSHRVRTQHRAIAASAVERVGARHPDLPVAAELHRDNPAAALAAAARHSCLMVIGTHGRGILAGGWMGSLALDLIGTVPTPVCVVPATASDR